MSRLRTVRSKLLALVGLTAVVMLVSLPVLQWVIRSELEAQATERVAAGEASFEVELQDDVTEVTVLARVLARDERTGRALQQHDEQEALVLAREFAAAWPHLDMLLFDAAGVLVAQVGCDHPRPFADFGAKDGEQATLLKGGCEAGPGAPYAWVVQVPVATGGRVVACLPFDQGALENAGAKLHLELALLDPEGAVLEHTPGFPNGTLTRLSGRTGLETRVGHSWAAARFTPRRLDGGLSVIAAKDITDLRGSTGHLLWLALGVLCLATLASLFVGARMASAMSLTLGRISQALLALKQNEYLHVEPGRTGDELEDLARGFNSMVDGLKERDHLRTTLGKYITEKVVEHLLAGRIRLGGDSIDVTILFSDIRGFTTISEHMPAESLVSLLNEYFTDMVAIVMAETGVVDKYIGDAIMAVFGAPVPHPDDAEHAVRAALGMRTALHVLNARLVARGMAPLATGIGIHTGRVVAGNIGSEQRMEYTVIGDTVNVASRLESSTTDLTVDVLISEETYALVKHLAIVRPVQALQVKGRAQPVMAYELIGLKEP
jgi:adenylate cyclase